MEKYSFTFTPDDGFYERFAEELAKRLLVPGNTAPPARQSNWLTHQEAAAYLKKTPATLYKLTSDRKIKYSKRGKSNYYRIEDIERYLSEGEIKTADEIIATSKLAPKRNIYSTSKIK